MRLMIDNVIINKFIYNRNIYFKFKIIYNEFGDNMNLNELSLKEKIGQKFIFGINSSNVDEIINLITNYSIGGVILYKKNYSCYDEMLSVIKKLKKANSNNKLPLFIAIDQEGGRVNRMPSEFSNVKNIYDMSLVDKELIYDNGIVTGKMLSGMGINMNFAPVLDLNDNNGGKVLYNRCFSAALDDVGVLGMKYVDGIGVSKVISVVKHFPGHGISKMDSHFITPYIYNSNLILDKHIKPFEYAIKKGIDAIMLNHLVIRGMTGGIPASISSRFIKEYIRDRYNYDGLLITDEINMLSRNIFYGFGRMKRALLSGSDIILVKISDKGNKIIDNCVKIIDKNREYISMIDDSVRRVIKIKEKYNVNDNVDYDGCIVDEINEEIDRINKKCL